MSFLFLYLLKLSLSLSVVYLFYYVVLRKLTFYTWNRWYLLLYTGLAFFIPFADISPVLEKNAWEASGVISWVPVLAVEKHTDVLSGGAGGIDPLQPVLITLLAGMLLLGLRLAVQLYAYHRMVRKARCIGQGKYSIYQVDEKIIPFSFGKSIFVNRHQHTESELREIILHEFIHVKQRHSADILWGEWLCLLNWYNPFAWLLRKAIRENLEFIADRGVIEQGVDRKQYQYLLLKVTGNRYQGVVHPFNFSSLKKRIAMMNKLKTAKIHFARFLFLLPVLAVVLLSFRKITGHQADRAAQQVLYPVKDTVPKAKLPENVKRISVKNNEATVYLKDGKAERYNLDDEQARKKFHEKYGALPPPPPPPPPVPGVPPAPPAPPVPPVRSTAGQVTGEFEINDRKAVMKRADGTTEEFDLQTAEGKRMFEERYGKLYTVSAGETTGASPVIFAEGANDQTVIAPFSAEVADEVMVVDNLGQPLAAKVEILLTITRQTTREELDILVRKMKEKGVVLKFDNVDFNDGQLVEISGSMRSEDGQSNFVARDFYKLTLSVIRKGDRSYFKVRTFNSKVTT